MVSLRNEKKRENRSQGSTNREESVEEAKARDAGGGSAL